MNEQCEGILVSVVDAESYRSLDTGIVIIHTIKSLYPDQFRWLEDWENPELSFFDKLAGGTTLRHMIDSGSPLEECLAFAHEGETAFISVREKYLLY